MAKKYISYEGSAACIYEDGEALDKAIDAWEEFVLAKLVERFPDHQIEVGVYKKRSLGQVRSNVLDLDPSELRIWIENELWVEWCNSRI